MLERSLSICRASLGDEHLDTATAMFSLGSLFTRRKDSSKFDEAHELLSKSLSIRKRRLGPNHPDVANVLDALGLLLLLPLQDRVGSGGGGGVAQSVDAFSEARGMFLDGLAIRQRVKGDEDLETASSLFHLGSLHLQLFLANNNNNNNNNNNSVHDLVEAKVYLAKCLLIRAKVLGERHRLTREATQALHRATSPTERS